MTSTVLTGLSGEAHTVSPPAVRTFGRRWLFAIISVSVAARLVWAVLQENSVQALPGVFDQISYDALARSLAAGQGFQFNQDWWPMTRAGEPTAHWSFLYTGFLALVYSVFGHLPVIARLIQACAVGILQPLLVSRICTRLFGPREGLTGAAITALYAYFIHYSASLVTESFFIVAVLWVLDLSMRTKAMDTSQTPRSHWVKLGIAIGCAVLLRQVFLLFVPVLFAWIVWVSAPDGFRLTRTLRSTAANLLTVAAILAVFIVPWTVRNYVAFKRPVLLNTNAGYALYWANHPVHGASFVPIFSDSGATYRELIPEGLRTLNEAELDVALLRLALSHISADPVRYLKLSLSRGVEYFKFWPTSGSGTISNLARVFSFGLILPFVALGIHAALKDWKTLRFCPLGGNVTESHTRVAGVVLLLAFCVTYTFIHLLSWALVRYRLPVDGVLISFGSLGVTYALKLLGRRGAAEVVS